jgi:hypothetical protein
MGAFRTGIIAKKKRPFGRLVEIAGMVEIRGVEPLTS